MDRISTSNVWIEFDALGPTSFTLDGKDVLAEVDAIGCVLEAGKPPVVNVRLAKGVTKLTGDAVVQVISEGTGDPAMIVQFLESVDPTMLQDAALRNVGYGEGSPIELALAHLIKMAKGEET